MENSDNPQIRLPKNKLDKEEQIKHLNLLFLFYCIFNSIEHKLINDGNTIREFVQK